MDFDFSVNHPGGMCRLCRQDIYRSNGCTCSIVVLSGYKYKRIKYGYSEYEIHDRCDSCNVLLGNYHHYGCNREICPVCGKVLVECKCDVDFVIDG